jgi:hypothetical protein
MYDSILYYSFVPYQKKYIKFPLWAVELPNNNFTTTPAAHQMVKSKVNLSRCRNKFKLSAAHATSALSLFECEKGCAGIARSHKRVTQNKAAI